MSYSGFKRKDWASGRSPSAPLAVRGYKAGGQTTHVVHREFISNVQSGPSSNGAFNRGFPSGQPINPGNAQLFPWLSRVAQAFVQYKVNHIKFHYVSTSGEFTGGASGNAALGSFNMCVQYNSNAVPYGNKAQMLNEEGAVSVVPSRDACLHVKVQPQSVLKKQYIRGPGIQGAAYDPLMYDLGVLYCATDGTPTPNITLGEIWAEYDITLYKASQINATSGLLYQASGIIPMGSDPLLQAAVRGPVAGASSGAYWASSAGAAAGSPARVDNRMPPATTPDRPTLPETGSSLARPPSTTQNYGGVTVDGTAIIISGNSSQSGGIIQISMEWGPYDDPLHPELTAAYKAPVGSNADLVANPYVAGAWGDVIWNITNGVCLNCSSLNMTPIVDQTAESNSTTMYVMAVDNTKDIVITWADRGPGSGTGVLGGLNRVIVPYSQSAGAALKSMAWNLTMHATDAASSAITAAILAALAKYKASLAT